MENPFTEEWLAERNQRVFGAVPTPAPKITGTSKPKQNKYRVAPKEERTVGLLTFASKAEAVAYQTLIILQQSGEVVNIELQPVFKFPMNFEYRADFRVTYADGRVEVIDVKGFATPVFKLKAKCLAHFYPDVKLHLWGKS